MGKRGSHTLAPDFYQATSAARVTSFHSGPDFFPPFFHMVPWRLQLPSVRWPALSNLSLRKPHSFCMPSTNKSPSTPSYPFLLTLFILVSFCLLISLSHTPIMHCDLIFGFQKLTFASVQTCQRSFTVVVAFNTNISSAISTRNSNCEFFVERAKISVS